MDLEGSGFNFDAGAIGATGAAFKELWSDYEYAKRELRSLRPRLEEASDAASEIRRAALREGISDEEFERLDWEADNLENSFKRASGGISLDDALDIADGLE